MTCGDSRRGERGDDAMVCQAPTDASTCEPSVVRVWREGFSVSHAAMGPDEQRAFRVLARGEPFAEICAASRMGSTPTRRRAGRRHPASLARGRPHRPRSRSDARWMRRPALLTLLMILVASSAPCRGRGRVHLGQRMPVAAFDRLPADRLAVPAADHGRCLAWRPLDLPRPALLALDPAVGQRGRRILRALSGASARGSWWCRRRAAA